MQAAVMAGDGVTAAQYFVVGVGGKNQDGINH
jgi:hypothetical protein